MRFQIDFIFSNWFHVFKLISYFQTDFIFSKWLHIFKLISNLLQLFIAQIIFYITYCHTALNFHCMPNYNEIKQNFALSPFRSIPNKSVSRIARISRDQKFTLNCFKLKYTVLRNKCVIFLDFSFFFLQITVWLKLLISAFLRF